jgi:hypothetical protein
MTAGFCFRSRYPFPLNAPLIGFQKKPFGVLGKHNKTLERFEIRLPAADAASGAE